MQDSQDEQPGDLDERWRREILDRAWWLNSSERDTQAAEHDRDAAARDADAARRDRRAEERDTQAADREHIAFDRAISAIKTLALADRRGAQRWADALARVEDARVAHARDADDESAAELLRADEAGETVIVTLVQAALERDEARLQLQHIAQHLAAAERDRRESAADRAAAATDRDAARRDRESARAERRQASVDRAADEPGST